MAVQLDEPVEDPAIVVAPMAKEQLEEVEAKRQSKQAEAVKQELEMKMKMATEEKMKRKLFII